MKRHPELVAASTGISVFVIAFAFFVFYLIGTFACYSVWLDGKKETKVEYHTSTVLGKDVTCNKGAMCARYYLYLADGHTAKTSESAFDNTNIGDNWSYTTETEEWKPGVDPTPPGWVNTYPLIAASILTTLVAAVIWRAPGGK